MFEAHTEEAGFKAVLRPNRSGTLRGVHIFLICLLSVFIPTGVVFFFVGAWPVLGFMGGELVLLYFALSLSNRRSAAVECISLSEDALTVERINYRGEKKTWAFQPQWLRVEVVRPERAHTRLTLNSHGRSLSIGGFLTTDERLEVAEALKRALFPYQSPLKFS